MTREEILNRIADSAKKAGSGEWSSPCNLCGVLVGVIEQNSESLPESSVNDLLMVAASLMRDHVNSVEVDILAARAIYTRG